MGWWIALAVGFLVLAYAVASIKVVKEYERGVVFLFGKIRSVRDPGLHLVPALAERMVRVSLQVTTIDIPARELITSDSVTVQVNAVAWYRVVDPVKALVQVHDYAFAVGELANATLLSALREVPLDSLLRHREEIQERLTFMMEQTTEPWGLSVTLVEVRDVLLPESMRRAMAREAEAERERRAKIVSAQGELEAATALGQAAALLEVHPSALRLRELASLVEIASEKNSTIIFPLPTELQRLATAMADRLEADGRDREESDGGLGVVADVASVAT
jgi:regulator of protease activity HflC (stomatin/prohibitin superfamily)